MAVRDFRDFQVFVKPAGPQCNLACRYCYYLEKENLYTGRRRRNLGRADSRKAGWEGADSRGPDSGGKGSGKSESGDPGSGKQFRMPEILLEEYIVQHIEACREPVIRFSWHGGEPTVLGLDYFRKIVALQQKHKPPGQQIFNGMQTNGTLLDEEWARFLAEQGFFVGLSLDGPREIHDRFRVTKGGKPTFNKTLQGYHLLRRHGVSTDILCVVNALNVKFPREVYGFFKHIGASYISFLPAVMRDDAEGEGAESRVNPLSVPADAWGEFLCAVFDEWMEQDIGRLKVQIFEEAARTAFKQEHSLCIFRRECGDIPVVEHNGDFYSCDHFVDKEHRLGNIVETPLRELLASREQRAFGRAKWETLPRMCRECEVRDMCNGECPKNRFVQTPEGEDGLNYLCAGYKRFFTHCRPWVEQVAAEWQKQKNKKFKKFKKFKK